MTRTGVSPWRRSCLVEVAQKHRRRNTCQAVDCRLLRRSHKTHGPDVQSALGLLLPTQPLTELSCKSLSAPMTKPRFWRGAHRAIMVGTLGAYSGTPTAYRRTSERRPVKSTVRSVACLFVLSFTVGFMCAGFVSVCLASGLSYSQTNGDTMVTVAKVSSLSLTRQVSPAATTCGISCTPSRATPSPIMKRPATAT